MLLTKRLMRFHGYGRLLPSWEPRYSVGVYPVTRWKSAVKCD